MRFFKNELPAGLAVGFMAAILFSGCASAPIVEPTSEEASAARPYKKTVAVINVSEEGSPIRGISKLALAKLENLFVGRFNLVDRNNIDAIMAERGLAMTGALDLSTVKELGKPLGADYMVFAVATTTISGPRLNHSKSKNKDGKFHGNLWDDYCSQSEVSMKIVETSSGVIVYAESKEGSYTGRTNEEYFKDEQGFERSREKRSRVDRMMRMTGNLNALDNQYSILVSQSIDMAVREFSADLKNKFAQSGEILQIISEQDVLINLGSAFGIRPGDALIIWGEGTPIQDPRTGLLVAPRTKRAELRVIQVNSGLTCVARGGKNAVAQLKAGDKVYTH